MSSAPRPSRKPSSWTSNASSGGGSQPPPRQTYPNTAAVTQDKDCKTAKRYILTIGFLHVIAIIIPEAHLQISGLAVPEGLDLRSVTAIISLILIFNLLYYVRVICDKILDFDFSVILNVDPLKLGSSLSEIAGPADPEGEEKPILCRIIDFWTNLLFCTSKIIIVMFLIIVLADFVVNLSEEVGRVFNQQQNNVSEFLQFLTLVLLCGIALRLGGLLPKILGSIMVVIGNWFEDAEAFADFFKLLFFVALVIYVIFFKT